MEKIVYIVEVWTYGNPSVVYATTSPSKAVKRLNDEVKAHGEMPRYSDFTVHDLMGDVIRNYFKDSPHLDGTRVIIAEIED